MVLHHVCFALTCSASICYLLFTTNNNKKLVLFSPPRPPVQDEGGLWRQQRAAERNGVHTRQPAVYFRVGPLPSTASDQVDDEADVDQVHKQHTSSVWGHGGLGDQRCVCIRCSLNIQINANADHTHGLANGTCPRPPTGRKTHI